MEIILCDITLALSVVFGSALIWFFWLALFDRINRTK